MIVFLRLGESGTPSKVMSNGAGEVYSPRFLLFEVFMRDISCKVADMIVCDVGMHLSGSTGVL